MSLSHIRTIRRNGGKPAIVTVVVGKADDRPLRVVVGERAKPEAMDWLPLMGVWVTVHWLSGSRELALAVVAQLEAAGAKLFGASSADGCVSLTANPTEAEVAAVRREWELLCTA